MVILRRLIVRLLQILLWVSAFYGVRGLYRGVSYQPVEHHALLGQPFVNISGISTIRCSARCLSHRRCSSFNYDNINRVCQMNNATKQIVENFKEMQTFTYYEATAKPTLCQFSNVSGSVNSTNLTVCLCNTDVKLGVEDGSILEENLKASSSLNSNPNVGNKSTPSFGRLNKIPPQHKGFIGAWYPNVADTNQWIQVDLVNPTYVTGILTQGRQDNPQWVTRYKVQYEPPLKGSLVEVKDQLGKTMIFIGNIDMNDVVERRFFQPVLAVKTRIVPLEWEGFIALRFELLGCK